MKFSDVKAVFFDFGDTLATLSPSKEEIFRDAASSVGIELEFELVKRAYQIVDFHTKYSSVHVKDRDDFYRNYNQQICEALGISSYFNSLVRALAAGFSKQKRWQLSEGANDSLQQLRRHGIPLALVANWDSNLPDLTEQLGIKEFFTTIVSSQSVGVEKPDPAIFQRAIDALSLSAVADGVLYVGNEYRADVLGARAAGLIPVLIDRDGVYKHMDGLRFTSLSEWIESID